jgi:hypothetical protein
VPSLGRVSVSGRRAWIVLAVCPVGMLASAWSHAQSAAPGVVRLDYQADPHCSAAVLSPDSFVAEVHARSMRVRFSAEASRSLVVRMARDRHKLGGRIELHEADGTTTERTVSGATCEEVVSALGLVTALALDPLASTSSADASTPSASVTASATVAPTSTSAQSADAGARAREENGSVPLDRRAWSFGAGADAEAVFGVSPDPLFAVPVYFEATRALSPHVGLGGGLRFERAGETALTAGVGADFTWTAGAIDLCTVFRGGIVRFNACLRSHAGAIDAHGEGVTPQRSATRPWVDVGVSLALRLRIAAPVFIELAGAVGGALVQDRFFLEPSTTVFQASALTAHAGGGLGFEIW